MAKSKSKKEKKVLNLVKEEQVVVFRAARRGRTGGQFTASTMEELTALASEAGWTGDVKVTRLFVEPSRPGNGPTPKPAGIDAAGENNEEV